MYGILLAMLVYNLFLFFSIRERSYIYYVGTVASQLLFLFLDSKQVRYIRDELFNATYIVDMAERLIYPVMVIAALLFQRSLLRIWEHNPQLDRIVKILITCFGGVILLSFLPSEQYFQYSFVFFLFIGVPLALYNNIDAIRRGDVTALVHMAAMGVFLLGTVVLMLLQLVPFFPANIITTSAYRIGLIAQPMLLSISLAFRYNQIK